MKRTIIAVILALGLLLLMVPTAVSAAAGVTVVGKTGDGAWTNNTWKVEIYPGESKSTTLTLYNSSSNSFDVEVSITPDSRDNGNLTFELDELSFTMLGKRSTDVTLTVKANGSATPGPYTTELTIKSEVSPSPPVGGFGITRYLRVDLWGEDFKTRVTSAGEVRVDLVAASNDGMVALYITEGVLAQTEDEKRLKKIVVLLMEESPPAPKKGYIIGIAYDFSPAGATFDPFVELEMRYSPTRIPYGLDEEDLLIAYYDEEAGKWLELDGTVDIVGNTITAEISHLTAFTVLGYPAPTPTPTPVPTPTPPVEPEVVEPEVVEPPAPPYIPPEEPEPVIPWGLIVGMVVGLALVVGGIVYWRKRMG